MQNLISKIKSCNNCNLCKTATNIVPGEGNINADSMFIGEGPGKNEDLEGRPFVGQAGKFLDELLASIDLKRENVYITNVVKCRPPRNRDPLPEEIEACREWLDEQLRKIKPKLIILLGRHAMNRFLPGLRISADHGRAIRRNLEGTGEFVFFPVYHPAAALYNSKMKEPLFKDFKKIPKILTLIYADKHNLTSNPSPSQEEEGAIRNS